MRQTNQPRINFMSDVPGFLAAWDDQNNPENTEHVDIYTTTYGNINNTGQIGNYDGHALSPLHAQFIQAIEPGVRDMVMFFVQQKKWVTYTSCEGHRYDAQTRLHPVERHVGLLPRSAAEYRHVRAYMDMVVQQCHAQYIQYPIVLSIVELTLESENSTHQAIDVFFTKHRLAPWWYYFAQLPTAYQRTLALLRHVKYVDE